MFRILTAAAIGVAAWSVAGLALAEDCFAPLPPPPEAQRPVMPTPPADPPCFNATTGVSHCNNAQVRAHNVVVDKFNADVAAYNIKSRGYVASLNAWVDQVNLYAACEISALNRH